MDSTYEFMDVNCLSEEYLSLIEKEVMFGKGRWVADFTESFRNFKVKDVTFDAFISGKTRAKGFFLSKIVSYLVLPDYYVGCFIFQAKGDREMNRNKLSKLLDAVKSHMRKEELKWSWLIVMQHECSKPFKKFIENMKIDDVGVVFLETNSRELTYNSPLGKYMVKRLLPKSILKR